MRVPFLLLLAVAPLSAYGAPSALARAIEDTNRADDQWILAMLRQGSLDDALVILGALGRRADPYAGDLMEAIAGSSSGPNRYIDELLLRKLVGSVCLRPAPPAEGSANDDGSARPDERRIEANEAALRELELELQRFRDPELKGLLLALSPDVEPGGAAKTLVEEGEYLLVRLRETAGREAPSPEEAGFLSACARVPDEVLREQIVSMIALSRDAWFVRTARAVLTSTDSGANRLPASP